MNMDRKKWARTTTLKLAGKKLYFTKTANQQTFVNKIPWTLTFSENNQSFFSIADISFVLQRYVRETFRIKRKNPTVSGRAGSE